MSAFDPIKKAIEAYEAEIEATAKLLEEADADTLNEKTRDSAINCQRHPVGSTTPLPKAERLLLKVVARLEATYAPIYQEAMTGLLAQYQASEKLRRIQEARRAVKAGSMAPNDVPKETRAAIEVLKNFLVDKWHWGSQSQSQLQYIADLLRWHAKDPRRKDPDNPWRILDQVYAGRVLGDGKLFRPVQPAVDLDTSTNAPEAAPASLAVPSRAELRTFLAENVLMAPEGLDSTMGGVASLPALGVQHLPMWERASRATSGVTATMMDWYHIEVPRGPYVLLHEPGQGTAFSDPKPEWLPPYKHLRQLGVEACMTPAEVQQLQELSEAGGGSIELALKAIRYFTAKLDLPPPLQEHLTRFWLFLLVGRHHPSEMERLCPQGYFHGVVGPDPANHDGLRGALTIVRSQPLDDNAQEIRRQFKTPWIRGWGLEGQ